MKIIFDTDMESDVDDFGALALLHGLAANGEAEILGTMVCSLNPWSMPTVDAINTYWYSKDFGCLQKIFPQDIGLRKNAPDAIVLTIKILSKHQETSVVIVTVGYLPGHRLPIITVLPGYVFY